jgi:hypothetical protein
MHQLVSKLLVAMLASSGIRHATNDTSEDYTNARRLCVVATRSLPRGALCNTEVSVTADINGEVLAPPKARRPRWASFGYVRVMSGLGVISEMPVNPRLAARY